MSTNGQGLQMSGMHTQNGFVTHLIVNARRFTIGN